MGKKTNKLPREKKQKKRYISIATKWLSLVALTITVSFLVFSFVIYFLISNQLMGQEQKITRNTVDLVSKNLSTIDKELTVTNVVTTFSPATKAKIEGTARSEVSSGEKEDEMFSDSSFSSLTRPDLAMMVFNRKHEVVFATRTIDDEYNFLEKEKTSLETKKGKTHLTISQAIVSDKTGKVTGYVVVQNQMNDYNAVLSQLRNWMFGIALVAILLTILISYAIVRSILRPIKLMSKVAKEVDDAPEATDRIPELNTNDELSDLTTTFNQMLDRMQGYIDQQKRFVEDVSHELRTPVAVIEGHLNLLQRWGKDDPQVLDESINASVQEISRMKHLIQEMLDLTRAEQIEILYPDEVTKVNSVVEQVVENLQLVHPDFKIKLDNDLKTDTLVKIYRNHLEQILIILLDNAIKYSTDRKEVIVSVSSDLLEFHMSVQDFGEGISSKEVDKIFSRFYRVDKARTREKGGNGLGLPIAKKLIESYNGTIAVESVEGSGSQFKITFPMYFEQI